MRNYENFSESVLRMIRLWYRLFFMWPSLIIKYQLNMFSTLKFRKHRDYAITKYERERCETLKHFSLNIINGGESEIGKQGIIKLKQNKVLIDRCSGRWNEKYHVRSRTQLTVFRWFIITLQKHCNFAVNTGQSCYKSTSNNNRFCAHAALSTETMNVTLYN